MGFKSRRKNFPIGRSIAFTIPKGLNIGEETSLAADAIILADPTGKIDESDLLEFLETHVEPAFWEWLKEKEAKKGKEKGHANQIQRSQ